MRFLTPTSPYHLRLGYLRIIASLVGKQRVPPEKLRDAPASSNIAAVIRLLVLRAILTDGIITSQLEARVDTH